MSPQLCKVFRGSESGKIISEDIERQMEPDQALVEITHSSLCGTDQFYTKAPQVLGHEGVGIVRKIGSAVKSIQIGDKVGMHYRQQICMQCHDCVTGWDQFCLQKKDYGKLDPNQGTFATMMTWSESTLIKLPADCEAANAATLMCSGATVWTVLACNGLKPGARVGVMGIGGLGHLAIKIASALDLHVVAFSSSERKRMDCDLWGAKEYIVYQPGQPTSVDGSLDALLLCGHGQMDFGDLLPLMSTHGTIYVLTIAFEPSSVPSLALVSRGLSIKGSHVASTPAMHEMLQFCVDKDINADIQRYPFTTDGLDEAFRAMEAGEIRYKAVLCRDS